MRVVEIVGSAIAVGSLILLGFGKISFDQALTLISIGVSLIAGKYAGKLEERLG